MGDRLRVDYAAVEGLIGDMKGYEGNIEDLYSDMTTTVSSLVSNGYMEAESATAYVEEFKNMLVVPMRVGLYFLKTFEPI